MRRFLLALFSAATLSATLAPAQTLTNLFTYDLPSDGSLAANPASGFIQANDGYIYVPIATGGDANQDGAILRISPSFAVSTFLQCDGTNCSSPVGILQLQDGNFYVLSGGNGITNMGFISRVTPAGVSTNLYSFHNTTDGAFPTTNFVYDYQEDSLIGATIGYNGATGSTSSSISALGTVWKYQLGLKAGVTAGFAAVHQFVDSTATTNNFGFQPVDGVTVVNGNVYGTSQVDGAAGFGETWYLSAANLTPGAVLHTFTNGADGAYPSGALRYSKNGFLYGTTLQNDGPPDWGSIYKEGRTSGFSAIYTFTAAQTNPNGTPIFDTAGNLILTAGKSGANGVGQILYKNSGNSAAPVALFTAAEFTTEGDHPISTPFFDNKGHLWTDMLGGGNTSSESVGAVDAWQLSTETAAPITIAANPATVAPNASSSVAWSTSNAVSDNEQFCWAGGTGSTAWAGVKTGTYSSGTLSGSGSVAYPSTGDYTLTITCGGTESAITTLHVRDASATFLTASANPVTIGSTETFTVSVSGNGTGATGTVALTANGTAIGTINLATGTTLNYNTASLAPGTYSIVATYSGDLQYSSSSKSLTLTVNSPSKSPTTTALTISPSSIPVNGSTTLTATVKKTSGTGVPTGNVTFSASGTTLATAALNASGVAAVTGPATGIPAGTYTITAAYAGDGSDTSSSGTANLSIKQASTTTLAISPTTVKEGASVNVTITVTGSSGTATGNATLMTGSTALGTVALSSGGKITFPVSTSSYPPGSYPVYVVYAGDSTYAQSTSNTVTVSITN